jgi:autotransporter-associated beta strand protein
MLVWIACGVCSGLFAQQLPAPKLYYPLDGTLPPVTGVMPVNGTAVFGSGQSGFGLAVTNSNTALRAPLNFHEGAEPGTSDWTLSFWARFTWNSTVPNFRLFSKGGRDDSGELTSGFQLYCRSVGTFSAFFATRSATSRERIDANQVYTKFKHNEWNHFVFMRRGDAMRIYLNGEYIAQKQSIAGGAFGDYGVKTGSSNSAISTQLSPESAVPNWGLDDVATWMTALTDGQVTELYTQGTNGVPLSGLATIPAYATVQDGAWETAATWAAQPQNHSTAFVRHEVAAASALPDIFTLAVGDDATLTLGSGAALAVTKTGADALRVGHSATGTLALAGGAALNVAGAVTVGAGTDGVGTLSLTGGAVLNKTGGDSITIGAGNGNSGALTMQGGTIDVQNSGVEFSIGSQGGRGAVALTDSAVNIGARLDFGRHSGSRVEAVLTRATLLKAGHDGSGLLFCEGGAATGVVTVVDSTLAITRSGGTGASAIQLAPGTGGQCVLTNINSTVEVVSTNGSRISIAGGGNSRVTYVQEGDAARLVSPGDIRIGDGAGSATEFIHSGGEVLAAGDLWLAPSSTAAAEYRLAGGTLSARGVIGGSGAGARLVFDGGTCRVAAHSGPLLMDGNVQVVFAEGKQAVFDTDGKDVALLRYHAPQGAGGLTKQGGGMLRIPGGYTGPTLVEEGTLSLYDSAASSSYTVAEGATLRFDGPTNTAAVAVLALDGALEFGAAAGTSMARLDLTGAAVTLGGNAKIAFPAGLFVLPGKSFIFLETADETLGALAQNAENIPAGWMVAKEGALYTLQEIVPSSPPLGRDDVIVWLSRETIEALPLDAVASHVDAFSGSGLVISNAPRNDLLAEVKALYFNGAAGQYMHGPPAPAGIVGNDTWSAAMWVWSGNRNNHEPTVVCWGMRPAADQTRKNCALNHASTEARAASFFGADPKYVSGAPALDSWQHIVFSYSGATSGQGLTVYVNGEPRTLNMDINTLRIPDNGQSILLGNQHNSQPQGIESRPYEGFLGELAVFDGTLSQQDAEMLYALGAPVYVGSDALPDDDQVFETAAYDNWTDADGWRNGAVPYNNSALVTGAGVSVDVDSAVPAFRNLRVEDDAAVNVLGVAFRPDGVVAVSNGAAFTVSAGGLLDPVGHVYVAGGSTLTVTGPGSKLFAQALDTPVRVGNETPAPGALNVSDGGEIEIRNSNLHVGYNTDAHPGNGLFTLSGATLKVGSTSLGGSLYVGHQSGEGLLTATGSVITVTKGNVSVASSADNGTAAGGLILDDTRLNVIEGGMRLGFCEGGTSYRSMNVAGPLVFRNKSSVTVASEFILGNRNAASDFGQPMAPNTPSVLVLDDSTLTLNNWGSIARQNGLGTLIVTNNAQVIKKGVNHFRIGTDGNAAAGQGAGTNPYAEGRVHVSAGGLLDVQVATNELRIAASAADKGILTIAEGGTVRTHTVTGNGTRGALAFDGGTLQARSSTNLFVNCAVPLLVSAGKAAVIDTQAYSVAIPRPFGGEGGIRKLGSGTLTLSALSTNTGPVTVEAGTLELPDGSGVGGLLTVPASAGATVKIGTSNVADTVSLGGLHLEKEVALDITAPGVCDKLVFTTTAGFTAESGIGLTLGYDPEQAGALFGNPAVKYLIAQAPLGCLNGPVIVNLPQGWLVAAQPSGGQINYILTSSQGTVLRLK